MEKITFCVNNVSTIKPIISCVFINIMSCNINIKEDNVKGYITLIKVSHCGIVLKFTFPDLEIQFGEFAVNRSKGGCELSLFATVLSWN